MIDTIGKLTAAILICILPACEQASEIIAEPAPPPPPTAQTGEIAGIVTGAVVEGVDVTLTGAEDRQMKTDAVGNYSFTELPAGSYTVTVSSDGVFFTPTARNIDVDQDVTSDADFSGALPPVIPPPGEGFEPTEIGDELWAWGWAGKDAVNLKLVTPEGVRGTRIEIMTDLSGRGNHWGPYPTGPTTRRMAPYATHLDLTDPNFGIYKTSHGVIGVDEYPDGTESYGNVFTQSEGMNAADGWYLACALVNTRGTLGSISSSGNRFLFGQDDQNYVWWQQGSRRLVLRVDGVVERVVEEDGLPMGLLILEVWREEDDTIKVMANGKDVTIPGVKLPGLFDMKGFGWDGSGSDYNDDCVMELICCDTLPPAEERAQLRGYLYTKWESEE